MRTQGRKRNTLLEKEKESKKEKKKSKREATLIWNLS